MTTRARYVKPENVIPGDLVRVTYKAEKGVVLSRVGTVAYRTDHGSTRHMMTAEGAVLFAWEPYKTPDYRVTLLQAASQLPEPLFV